MKHPLWEFFEDRVDEECWPRQTVSLLEYRQLLGRGWLAKWKVLDVHKPVCVDVGVWYCEECECLWPEGSAGQKWPCLTVRALAQAYQNHPDFPEII